jgi:hypothetical protein
MATKSSTANFFIYSELPCQGKSNPTIVYLFMNGYSKDPKKELLLEPSQCKNKIVF